MSNRRRKRKAVKAMTWQNKLLWGLAIGGFTFVMIYLLNGQTPYKRRSLSGQIVSAELLKESQPFDITHGQDTAPVTIIEYASLTCGHCKSFHDNVVIPLKKSGFYDSKARLIFRHYPLNKPALDAAVLLSCVSQGQAKNILDKLFSEQKKWALAESPLNHFKQYFLNAGMSDSDIYTCLADEKRVELVVSGQHRAQKELGVRSTPTVFINETLYTGPHHIEGLQKVIMSELENSKKQ